MLIKSNDSLINLYQLIGGNEDKIAQLKNGKKKEVFVLSMKNYMMLT
jgi:hypothetical protein